MLSFILTFSPSECQTKSFEKINTLLSVIFKFCTTKNLFKILLICNDFGVKIILYKHSAIYLPVLSILFTNVVVNSDVEGNVPSLVIARTVWKSNQINKLVLYLKSIFISILISHQTIASLAFVMFEMSK